ncbi:MAG: penicillin-binding protein [Intrasporangium sp.]|uniref:penicillin-binding transpeptidase domain-containing protein n=1 Tax=Intrasporangium sp. TaxID=1925024 RepID=UPI0026486428|nr:penicillin-binding transpeptidase domain-containing protein [Intrasporangium sp.]MDN5796402.1 penicillin-binding protein [Intrasporangium sp.]
MTSTARRRSMVLALAAVLVTGPVSACSMFDKPPTPDGTMQALADGLSSGNLARVPLTGVTPADATTFVERAYKGMGDARPNITVTDVKQTEGSDKATATFVTQWDVSKAPNDWRYETQVPLTLVDGTWRVTWSPSLVAPDLTREEVLALVTKWPKRADILAADGRPLMTEREVTVVGIDKTHVSGADATKASAAKLAKVLGIDADSYADKVAKAGPEAFVPALTLRTTDKTLTKNIAAIDAVKGASRNPRMMVLGPTRTWAAPILGTVGEATAEQVEKSDGTLQAGDEVGQSGLQLRYDKQLRGAPGLAVQALTKGADGSTTDKRELYAELSTDGTPLRLTLDEQAQTGAEKALAKETKHPTALVAVRVSTGEIVAAAVGPGTKGASLALAGRAAPGSTFKLASSLALVRHGATADTKLPCTNTLTVDGRRFGNYSHYPENKLGDITLATALAYSCNTAFISQYKKVSQQDLISAAHSLGVGEDLDLPWTGFLGSVPPTDNVVEHAASLIGQGRVEASPLAMAIATASVMRGQTVRPRLIADEPSLPAPDAPLEPTEAELVRSEMRAVVKEGSGKVLQPVGVEYAKTGTAEFGTGNPPKTHAWMVAGRGDLAIAAYNEIGPSGTTHAAPFIISFLRSYDIS